MIEMLILAIVFCVILPLNNMLRAHNQMIEDKKKGATPMKN